MKDMRGTIHQRFAAKVFLGSPCGCHYWVGAVSNTGYGMIHFIDKSCQAHRVSYILNKGQIPDGMFILHSCDNRLCVNPDHLKGIRNERWRYCFGDIFYSINSGKENNIPMKNNAEKDAFASKMQNGLNKREYFAGLAMQSFISSKGITTYQASRNEEGMADDVALASIAVADALLKQLGE